MSKIMNNEASEQTQENLKKLVDTVDKTVNQTPYCRNICESLKGKDRDSRQQREWDDCGCPDD